MGADVGTSVQRLDGRLNERGAVNGSVKCHDLGGFSISLSIIYPSIYSSKHRVVAISVIMSLVSHALCFFLSTNTALPISLKQRRFL